MGLRKYISTLLTCLILISNMGLAISVHYCHGEIAKVSFAYKKAGTCGKHLGENKEPACGSEQATKKGCCKDELVKLHHGKSDNIIVKSLHLDLGAFYPVAEWNSDTTQNSKGPLVKKDTPSFYCESHAPPLFKLYCQYIFYA